MRILGIETSCDDTAIALIDAAGEFDSDFSFRVLGNALISQSSKHTEFGGVYPNVAKREHQRNLVPVLMEALRQGKQLVEGKTPAIEKTIESIRMTLSREPELLVFLGGFLRSYRKPEIECIAVTVGPGLEPALWVGINFAKALSIVWNVPIVPVNHMEGHVVMSLLGDQRVALATNYKLQATRLPLLSLLISGGHTELVLSRKWMVYEYLGRTRDDAVGEAFDKVARLLGLPYPGGPHISRLAAHARKYGHSMSIFLPRPMLHENNYDFSFAGLKTAVSRLVEKNQPMSEEMKGAIAREFEDAVADVLVAKTMRAIEEYNAQTLVVSGGVSANTHIRNQFENSTKDYGLAVTLFIPPPQFSTDNALMIALAGYFRAANEEFTERESLRAKGDLKLAEKA